MTKKPRKIELNSKVNVKSTIEALATIGNDSDVLPYLLDIKSSDTFALPSNALMFTLLALFSGKPERIPRNLILKPDEERTEAEKKKVQDFFKSILKEETEVLYDMEQDQEIKERKLTAIVADNAKVEAEAEITNTLFSKDLVFREEALAMYIKKTYGAEGLRHLLALLIGLEENGRTGRFEWNLNEHLERLGYKKNKGTFRTDLKQTATHILVIFCSLYINARRKDKDRSHIQAKRLFAIEGYDIEEYQGEIINSSVSVQATSYWYKNMVTSKDEKTAEYTKLLKRIVKENHRERELTIYLSPLLAIFWRMELERDIKVERLLDWCSYPDTPASVRKLISELEYMKEKQYLGDYHPKKNVSKETVLTLTPPEWLNKELQKIEQKRKRKPPKQIEGEPLTREQFTLALQQSGLTQLEFANTLGITRQHVNYIKNGKRNISVELSNKIIDKFPFILRDA